MPFSRFDGAGNDLYNLHDDPNKKYFTGRVLRNNKRKKRNQKKSDVNVLDLWNELYIPFNQRKK